MKILAIAHQNVEGVGLYLVVVPARMQAVEIRSPIDAEQYGLAIEDERAVAVAQRSLGDQREAIAPVVAVARSIAARTCRRAG